MQIVFAAAGVIGVFWVVFWLVQKAVARTLHSFGPDEVRRTLENGAQTLGGSDYLRLYPPVETGDEPPRAEWSDFKV